MTPHFKLCEFTDSPRAKEHGIDNTAPPDVVKRLRITAVKLETIRALLGQPMIITSGYRCPRLNRLVGGQWNSAHLLGYAADFVCPQFGTNYQVAMKIARTTLDYDQLILEYDWVHISFDPRNRRECLTKRSASTPWELGLNP